MKKFLKKLNIFIALPSFLLLAASPLGCSVSKDGGVFKSADYGVSWTQKVKVADNKNIGTVNVLSLAIDNINPNIIYLGSRENGLIKSTDEAETWIQVVDKNKVLQVIYREY